jgi:hypothetical protein
MITFQRVTPDVPFAVSYRLGTPRLDLPAHEARRPAPADGLHSHLMGLRR